MQTSLLELPLILVVNSAKYFVSFSIIFSQCSSQRDIYTISKVILIHTNLKMTMKLTPTETSFKENQQ